MEDKLIKQIVDEFEHRVSALVLNELQERNLLSAVVDEQVRRELGVEIVGGLPFDAQVPPEEGRKAQERHAYLFAETERERARRLDALDTEGLMNDDE